MGGPRIKCGLGNCDRKSFPGRRFGDLSAQLFRQGSDKRGSKPGAADARRKCVAVSARNGRVETATLGTSKAAVASAHIEQRSLNYRDASYSSSLFSSSVRFAILTLPLGMRLLIQ